MTQDSVTIRLATLDDAEAIATCFYRAVHEKGQGFYPDDVMQAWGKPVTPERIAKFRTTIAKTDEETYVAEVNGVVIGMMIIRPSDAKMGCLYIAPNKYGRVGSRLMDYAIMRMKACGQDHMVLDSSLPAEAFYRAYGFVETGRGIDSRRNMAYVTMRKDF